MIMSSRVPASPATFRFSRCHPALVGFAGLISEARACRSLVVRRQVQRRNRRQRPTQPTGSDRQVLIPVPVPDRLRYSFLPNRLALVLTEALRNPPDVITARVPVRRQVSDGRAEDWPVSALTRGYLIYYIAAAANPLRPRPGSRRASRRSAATRLHEARRHPAVTSAARCRLSCRERDNQLWIADRGEVESAHRRSR
jgi:hypothetical protein